MSGTHKLKEDGSFWPLEPRASGPRTTNTHRTLCLGLKPPREGSAWRGDVRTSPSRNAESIDFSRFHFAAASEAEQKKA